MKKFFTALGKGFLIYVVYQFVSELGEFIAKSYIEFNLEVECLVNGENLTQSQFDAIVLQEYADLAYIVTMISAFVLFAILFIILKLSKRKVYNEINFRSIRKSLIPFLVLAAISAVVIQHVLSFIIYAHFPQTREFFEFSVTNIHQFQAANLMFLPALVFIPIMEEIFFRGLIFAKFNKAMPLAVAIIIQTILYASINFRFGYVILAVIISVITCIISIKGKSILGAIIFHFTFNLFMMFEWLPIMTDELWHMFSVVIFPIAILVLIGSMIAICMMKPSKRISKKVKFE